jgi:adenylylsulfate kinase
MQEVCAYSPESLRAGRPTATGFTVWLTGLSGAGKSTIARALHVSLADRCRSEILDGDEIRAMMGGDLGFSRADRDANVLRLGLMARLLSRNGIAVIVASMSPFQEARELVRQSHEAPFVEVFVDCSLRELAARDTKGLYALAARGEIDHLSGVSAPYEAPAAPDVHLRTDCGSPQACVERILAVLTSTGLVSM